MKFHHTLNINLNANHSAEKVSDVEFNAPPYTI